MVRYIASLAIMALMIAFGTPAHAGYPNKPITVIVPFMSTADVFQLVTDGLQKELGVPVKLEVHPGTGGLRAMLDLLDSKPDGYTLAMGMGPNLIMSFYDKKPYDITGLTYIGLTVAFQPSVLAVPKSYKGTLKDLVAQMRREGSDFVWASGTRTTAHMAGLQFMTAVHAKTFHQETKNANLSLSMLLGGHVNAAIESGSFIGAAIARGAAIRPIAVLADEHHDAFPGVAIPRDIGVNDHFRLMAANVLVSPPHTPPAIAQRLREALYKTLHDPAVVAHIRAVHFDVFQSPLPLMEQRSLDWLHGETALWDQVRERYGIDLLSDAR